MLDFIYHMTFKLFCYGILGVRASDFAECMRHWYEHHFITLFDYQNP